MDGFVWGQTGRRTNKRCASQGRLLLTDILHEAPRVLQLVSPDDKKALMAVCKSVHRLVHAFASSVTLQEDDSLEQLLDTAVGPHLQQLCMYGINLTTISVSGLTSAPWSALTSLTLNNCGLTNSTITQLAACKWWPELQLLSFRGNQLGSEAIKAMAGKNRPQLRHLDLSSNRLTAYSITQLTQLRWSSIETLDLRYNPGLKYTAIRKLAIGSWPVLKGLAVNGSYDLAFFAQVAGSWPLLETIQISCDYCVPHAVSFKGCWPNVKHLQIMTPMPSPFDVPAVSSLTEANWANLQSLDLSYSNLGRKGFTQLADGQWPLLRKLDVSRMQHEGLLSPDDVAAFAEGDWPKLTYLGLAHNGMSDDCAMELIDGDWPLLAVINLSYNNIGAEGGDALAVADWPNLEHLCLRQNMRDCCGCVIARHIELPNHVAPIFAPY